MESDKWRHIFGYFLYNKISLSLVKINIVRWELLEELIGQYKGHKPLSY